MHEETTAPAPDDEPPALAAAWRLARSGDVSGAMRELRLHGPGLPPADVAPLVGRVAALAGMDDLAAASGALAAAPGRPRELYEYGYACVERGASFLAVPALAEALRLAPDARPVLVELAAALEREERHTEAAALLREREAELRPWPERYLLAHNALLSGDVDGAREAADRLPPPDEDSWRPAHARLRRLLDRAAAARGPAPLDRRDLRGWHFTLTGGLLTTLSPYGWDAGMNGRYGYLQDSADLCLLGLRRLRAVLEASGRSPAAVAPLPDRSSRIAGLAAARLLGLPALPYTPGRPDTLVVAYDLRDADRELVSGLRERAPGEILFEHATCWTSPPAVSADVSTLLAQMCVPPWGARLRAQPDGTVERQPEDERPEEELAEELLAAGGEPDPGDGGTPPDPERAPAAFAAAVAAHWAVGPRDRSASPGPVASGRFT
ncbi:hypothetical protein GCM10027168_01270 [Streptomyces capparidis]